MFYVQRNGTDEYDGFDGTELNSKKNTYYVYRFVKIVVKLLIAFRSKTKLVK